MDRDVKQDVKRAVNRNMNRDAAGTGRHMRRAMLLAAVALPLAACGGGGYGSGMPASASSSGLTGPTITMQPASMTVAVGATATFVVQATGTAPVSYQWMRNGTAVANGTGASYTTPPTTAGDNGATFAVRVSNAYGTVTSSPAMLNVM